MPPIRPKKGMGQHFLHDKRTAQRIVNSLTGHGKYQHVVEVGNHSKIFPTLIDRNNMGAGKAIFSLLLACLALSVLGQEEERLSFAEIKEARIFFEKGEELMEDEKYAEAGQNFGKAFDIIKTNKQAGINAARAYAMAGDKTNTLDYIRKVIMAGGVYDFRDDPVFRSMRFDNDFIELMQVGDLMAKQLSNQRIEPLVILPTGYDPAKKYPMIVGFHGFSDNPSNFAGLYKDVARKFGCIMVFCRGTKVIGKELFAWNQEQEEYERLYEEVTSAIRKYSVDQEKVVLTGFWQGGLMAYGFGVVFSELFCGLLPVAANVPGKILVDKMENKKLRVFSIVGTDDNENMVKQNEQAEQLFQNSGVEFKLNKYPIRSHQYPKNKEEVLTEAFSWFLN